MPLIEVLREPSNSLPVKHLPILAKLVAQRMAELVNECLVHVESIAWRVGVFEFH